MSEFEQGNLFLNGEISDTKIVQVLDDCRDRSLNDPMAQSSCEDLFLEEGIFNGQIEDLKEEIIEAVKTGKLDDLQIVLPLGNPFDETFINALMPAQSEWTNIVEKTIDSGITLLRQKKQIKIQTSIDALPTSLPNIAIRRIRIMETVDNIPLLGQLNEPKISYELIGRNKLTAPPLNPPTITNS